MAPTTQQIYARRRALALVSILVVGAIIWFFSQSGSQTPEATPIVTVESTESAAPAEVVDCQPGVVVIEAKIGDEAGTKNSFGSGELPQLWYEITNTGAVDCFFNVGTRVTFFTITSGSETYWSSKDCERSDVEDMRRVLLANTTVVANKSPWERVRSSSEGCSGDLPSVPAGGASYFLKVEVNGVYSENDVQFLLN